MEKKKKGKEIKKSPEEDIGKHNNILFYSFRENLGKNPHFGRSRGTPRART
jgi:hypothetical protein